METQEQVNARQAEIYHKPIAEAIEQLRLIGVTPQWDVDIFPEWPDGWLAVTGSGRKVWCVRRCNYKPERYSIWSEPCLGIRENGSLIREEFEIPF